MSHIVIHDDSDNVTHYAEFDDVQSAATYLEGLVNHDDGANARLFALEPVEFAVKSYVRVEIGGAVDEPAPLPTAEVRALETVIEPQAPTPEPVAEEPVDDMVEYVEAAMTPVDTFAPTSDRAEPDNGGEARRGLFGR